METRGDAAVAVRFWGVRGSIPSPAPDTVGYGANTSCIELRVGDQLLILDAGSGIRRLGAHLQQEFGAGGFDATLLISHTHWDHIQGLPFFAPAYCDANRIRILTPPGKRLQIETALKNQMKPMHFPVRLAHLAALDAIGELPEGSARIGALSIRTTNLHHPGGCGGFRISARGTSIAYLPDHEPYHSSLAEGTPPVDAEAAQAALIAFVRNCDLLVLDTQYDEAEYPTRQGWGHGCLPDSVALAIEADVRELVLFHHDPSHGDEKIKQMLARAKELVRRRGSHLSVRAAREGDEIIIRSARALSAGSAETPMPRVVGARA